MKTITTSGIPARVFGLAITAVLAMSAFWAASAQAADPELHCTSSTNSCTVTGTEINRHAFNAEGGSVRCRSSYPVTLNAKTMSRISGVSPTYTSCRAFGVASTVNMNGCSYTFNSVEGSSPATVNVDIACPAGQSITSTSPSLPCMLTVGAQNGLAHIVLENGGGGEPTDVMANFTVTGINYNTVGSGCPSNGNKNNGTYNGETTLKGFNDPSPGTEGNEVGLHVKPL